MILFIMLLRFFSVHKCFSPLITSNNVQEMEPGILIHGTLIACIELYHELNSDQITTDTLALRDRSPCPIICKVGTSVSAVGHQ